MNGVIAAIDMIDDALEVLRCVPRSIIDSLPEYRRSQILNRAAVVRSLFDRPQLCEEGTQPLQAAE